MASPKKIHSGTLTRFEVTHLHGNDSQSIDLRIKDDRLILVGENGAGKTTLLNLLYYSLSCQWESLSRYRFSQIVLTIDGRRHVIKPIERKIDVREMTRRYQRRLPASDFARFAHLAQEAVYTGDVSDELVIICQRYRIPVRNLLNSESSDKESDMRKALQAEIREALPAQILYLPTYRRIEQELEQILHDVDRSGIDLHRRYSPRDHESFVELVEFGMGDVKEAVKKNLDEISSFQRDSMKTLTFGHLGDVIDAEYSNVNLKVISEASKETVESALNRIQEDTLSSARKDKLRAIIDSLKTNLGPDEHKKIICHYFAKLLKLHRNLEEKETQINSFCRVCTQYMSPNKKLSYDPSTFSFKIQSSVRQPVFDPKAKSDIELHQLSSGEKQIVSLFSHLYLSGGSHFMVLIDEPELSLSVPWQRKFLSDISNSDFCAGLIAVTHSPFIYDNELRQYAHGIGEYEVQ